MLDLIPKHSGAPIDAAANGSGTKAETGIGAELFRTTLAERLHTAGTAVKTVKTALVPADTATLKDLQAKIGKMLESGASPADAVSALAAHLAASVSQALETPTTDARAKLQRLFATALAPPGRADPAAPVTDRALALAQRFSRLANLADAIAGQPSGQQKRIAGNVLDAQRAKDIPAPTTTSDAKRVTRNVPGPGRTLPTNADADSTVPAVAAELDVAFHAMPAAASTQTSVPSSEDRQSAGLPERRVPKTGNGDAGGSTSDAKSKPASTKQNSGSITQSQTTSALKSPAVGVPPAAAGSLALPAIPASSGDTDGKSQNNGPGTISSTTSVATTVVTGTVQTPRILVERPTGPAMMSPALIRPVALEPSTVPEPATGNLGLPAGAIPATNGSGNGKVRQGGLARQDGLGPKAATSATTLPATRSVQISGAMPETRPTAPAKSLGDVTPAVSSSAGPDRESSDVSGLALRSMPATSGNDAGTTTSATAAAPITSSVRAAGAVTERRPAAPAKSPGDVAPAKLQSSPAPQASSDEIASSLLRTVFPTTDDGNDPKVKPESKTATASDTTAPNPATSQTSSSPAADAIVGLLIVTVPSLPEAAPVAVETAPLTASADSGIVLPEIIAASADGNGDARTVKLGSKAAVATDGDTTLGRILARAALAADTRDAAVAAGSDDSSDSTPSTPTAVSTVAVKSNATPSETIASFVKRFETALNAATSADTPKLTQDDTPAATSLRAQFAHAAADATPAFAPSAAPFTIERANVEAGSAPAAAASPTDNSAIADQVLRGAFMRNVGQSSEMRLTLAPSSLGDVTVKLVVNAGNVTAHVVAETPEVRDALVAAQPQLAKSLADSGLKLTGFSVDLSGNGAGFAQQHNDQPQHGGRSPSASAGLTDEGIDQTQLEAIPSFGPSATVRPNTGGYNYLA